MRISFGQLKFYSVLLATFLTGVTPFLAHGETHRYRSCARLLALDSEQSEFRETVKRRVDQFYPKLLKRLTRVAERPAFVDLDQSVKKVEEILGWHYGEFLTDFALTGVPPFDVRSAEWVTVYRIISDITKWQNLDLSFNYRDQNTRYNFEEDYVASSIDGVAPYIYDKKALLIQYELPAMFLGYSKFYRPESTYVIDRDKLKKFGISSPAIFTSCIFWVDSAEKLAAQSDSDKRSNDPIRSAREKIKASIRRDEFASAFLHPVSGKKAEEKINQALTLPIPR